MSGTKSGGKRAAAANKAKDPDFYKKIGALGGRISRGGYFSAGYVDSEGRTGPELAAIQGAKGGRASRRGKTPPLTPEQRQAVVQDLLADKGPATIAYERGIKVTQIYRLARTLRETKPAKKSLRQWLSEKVGL
jgi:uncharacterized protein